VTTPRYSDAPTDGKMNPEVKALWLDALRSGEYEQGVGILNESGRFCCLGVLCDVAVKQGLEIDVAQHGDDDPSINGKPYTSYDNEGVFLPDAVREWADLGTSDGYIGHPVVVTGTVTNDVLTALNDSGVPFSKIADIIEEEF